MKKFALYLLAVAVIATLGLIQTGCQFGQDPQTGQKTVQTKCTVCRWVWTSAGYKYVCTTQPADDGLDFPDVK